MAIEVSTLHGKKWESSLMTAELATTRMATRGERDCSGNIKRDGGAVASSIVRSCTARKVENRVKKGPQRYGSHPQCDACPSSCYGGRTCLLPVRTSISASVYNLGVFRIHRPLTIRLVLISRNICSLGLAL